MKKFNSNLFSSLVAASMLLGSLPLNACAAENSPRFTKVSLRIEGISECVCDKDVYIPTDCELTVSDIIGFADENDGSFTIYGLENGYITAVNEASAGKFGGWDGWLYRVGGVEPSAPMNEYTVSDGDEILLFYGDPYGKGMQFPNMERNGNTLTFTSNDTTYDENFDPVSVVNPVADMNVTIDGKVYKTNESGSISADELPEGDLLCSYDKYDENGLPLVLRSRAVKKLGDVNGDSSVDAVDASIILSAYSGISTGRGAVISTEAADVNGDKAFDAVDASKVLAYYSAFQTGKTDKPFADEKGSLWNE